jgi:two-component system, cell cycle response regulator
MKILIAEDDPVSRRLLQAKLVKWGYDVAVACDGDEAWQALQAEGAPRIAILDWMMPGTDGVDVCRRVRRKAPDAYTYIILLTALQRDDDLITGMEAGADDYITKPFKANELKVRLRAGRRIIELQNELIEAREALREKATHDPLTGLWNHEEILSALGRQLNRIEREGGDVSAIMVDIDHFKRVNDTYGHMAGDVVLRLVTKRILSLTRIYDYVGRYGGEEFLIVLPGCDRGHATALAERLRSCVSRDGMDIPEGIVPITISLGVATREKGGECGADSLVRRADLALYRAKTNGRDRVEVAAEEGMNGQIAYSINEEPRVMELPAEKPGHSKDLGHSAARE